MGTAMEEARLKSILSQIYAQDDPDPELYAQDEFRMYAYKVLPCHKRYGHDWTECPFAHPGEKATRRCPKAFPYSPLACPNMKKTGECPRSDSCMFAHNVFEYWLHPSRYRTQLCSYGLNCKRSVCFFAHHYGQLRLAEQFARVPGLDGVSAAGLSDADFGAFGGGGGMAMPFVPPSGGTVAVVPASQVHQVRSAAAAALANRQALAKAATMPGAPGGTATVLQFQQQQGQGGVPPGSTMALLGAPGEPLRLVQISDATLQQQPTGELVQMAPAPQQQQQQPTYMLQQSGGLPAGMVAAQGIVASRGGYGYQPMGASLQQILQQQQQQQAQQLQQQMQQQQQVANAQRLASALQQQQHNAQQQQATVLVGSGGSSSGSSIHDGQMGGPPSGSDQFGAGMQQQQQQSLQMQPGGGMGYPGMSQGGNGGTAGLEPSEVATAIKVLQQLLAEKGSMGDGAGQDTSASPAELASAMQHHDLVSAVSAFVTQRKATAGGSSTGEVDSDAGKDTLKHAVAGLLPQLLNQLAVPDQQRQQLQQQQLQQQMMMVGGGGGGRGQNVTTSSRPGVNATSTSRSSSGVSVDMSSMRGNARPPMGTHGFQAGTARGSGGMLMQQHAGNSYDSGSSDLGLAGSVDLDMDQLLMSMGLQQQQQPQQQQQVSSKQAQQQGLQRDVMQNGRGGPLDAQLVAQLRALGISDQQQQGLVGAGQDQQHFGRGM